MYILLLLDGCGKHMLSAAVGRRPGRWSQKHLTIRYSSKYRSDMKTTQIVGALGALAHEHRLAIFRLLVERGPAGLPAGKIAERVGLAPSSLTFHLKNLQYAGLIAQRRDSRQLIYSADFATMTSLVNYLTDNCCAESAADCCPPARQAKTAKRAVKAA
jgi:ArsR family transcriptional regulator